MAERRTDAELRAEIAAARQVGREAGQVEPMAGAVRYDVDTGEVKVTLTNGSSVAFSPDLVPGLAGASAEALADVSILGGGYAVSWDRLDVDFTVGGLVAGVMGMDVWLRYNAAEMGRRGGAAKTDAKAAAARENGRRGGRPPKQAASGESAATPARRRTA